jgi:hypothetical protein
MMDPAPEVVSFDTVLELTSSEFRGDTDGQRSTTQDR